MSIITKTRAQVAVYGATAAQIWMCIYLSQYSKDRSYDIGYQKAKDAVITLPDGSSWASTPTSAYIASYPGAAQTLYAATIFGVLGFALKSAGKEFQSEEPNIFRVLTYAAFPIVSMAVSLNYGFAAVIDGIAFDKGAKQFLVDRVLGDDAIRDFGVNQLELNMFLAVGLPLLLSAAFYMSVFTLAVIVEKTNKRDSYQTMTL